MTALDDAHAAMEVAPDDDLARLRFFERLADAELLVLLVAEPEGDRITPRIYPLSDGDVILAFDSEERLAGFAGEPVPYAAMSGRTLAGLLAGTGRALGVNLDVAPSAILLPAQALDWLAETLARRPERVEARPAEIAPPDGLPERLLEALDAKLPAMAGLADEAFLAAVRYADGRRGSLMAFRGVRPGAETPLAAAVGEAVAFSGLDMGELDVAFPEDPAQYDRLARSALRFVLPEPETPEPPRAPGSDPGRPPRLR